MMEDRLEFESIKEFKEYMEKNEVVFTDRIVTSVEEGISKNKLSVELFTLGLENSEELIITSLAKSEWENALETSLKYYTEAGESDKAIDTWKVLQKLTKE